MRALKSTIYRSACAIILVLAASPALAGHKHGGNHQYGGYGMPYGKPHHVSPRGAHPYCHSKAMKRGASYGNWGYPAHHSMRMNRSYAKPGWGYGAAYNQQKTQHKAKPAYGTPSKGDYGSARSQPAPAQKDLVGTAVAAGNFATLLSAVKAAGLYDTLSGKGPFTVLAPSDAAFGKLPKEQLEDLLGDPEALKDVLTYHVIAGELSAAELLEQGEATTVNGAKVTVAQLDVAKADIKTSNGVIHVLNAVLIPAE
jgi:uncharacterized surface protein with fasciclin (FAS1) repeats